MTAALRRAWAANGVHLVDAKSQSDGYKSKKIDEQHIEDECVGWEMESSTDELGFIYVTKRTNIL